MSWCVHKCREHALMCIPFFMAMQYMCLYMKSCLCICVWVDICVLICVCTEASTCVCACVRACMRAYVHACACALQGTHAQYAHCIWIYHCEGRFKATNSALIWGEQKWGESKRVRERDLHLLDLNVTLILVGNEHSKGTSKSISYSQDCEFETNHKIPAGE